MHVFQKAVTVRHALLRIGTHYGAGYTWNINVGYGMFLRVCMFLNFTC